MYMYFIVDMLPFYANAWISVEVFEMYWSTDNSIVSGM